MTADDRRLGVVGAGVMGAEIAQAAAAAGLQVVLRDMNGELVDRGLARIRAIGERRVARGRLTAAEADAILGRVSPATDDRGLSACGIVVEAVTEVLDIKRALVANLDAALPPDALIASNTSGLSITEIGRATNRPDRVLGLHFFNPASVMALVEVVRGADTSAATVERGLALVRALGKTPVGVSECPGFLVNRVLVRAMVEAYRRAVELDADRSAADAAVVDGGPAPMGAFALGDLVGLDTMDHIQRGLVDAYGERFADAGVLAAEVTAGRLGRKSGSGLVVGREETPADAAGHAVAEAYYAGARDEAQRCLSEGIVAAAEDVNLALRLGAGWERGPLD